MNWRDRDVRLRRLESEGIEIVREAVAEAASAARLQVGPYAWATRSWRFRQGRRAASPPFSLYRSALAGEIKNFTGVDQPYEAPEIPNCI
jgi:hypothetical protein